MGGYIIKRKSLIIILSVIILLVLCSLYLYYENTKLSISNYNVVNTRIPSSFNNFKIVQISDLHNTRTKKLVNSLIKEIKKQKPNIIVITGDLIDSKKYDLEVALDFIDELKSVAPIYYVSGNHEAWSSKYEDINSNLVERGVFILDNEYDTIEINDENIIILGVSDPAFYPSYLSEQTSSNLEDILDDLENNNFKILLSHRPELFETYANHDINLVLTGHAHGGQVRLPFFGGLIAPNQGLFPKYTDGKFEQNKTTMIVSRGIGNSIIPFRVNNRPELVTVTLNNE